MQQDCNIGRPVEVWGISLKNLINKSIHQSIMKRIHLLIHGRVHGVFFRYNAQKRARALGIVGWVKNIEEGVELVAQGEDRDVGMLVDYCRRGPLLSRVEDIEITEEKPADEFHDFEIRF